MKPARGRLQGKSGLGFQPRALKIAGSNPADPTTSAVNRGGDSGAGESDAKRDGYLHNQIHPRRPHCMPQRGHRVFGTTIIRVSKVVNAPLRYVYDWCTDYRSDDWRLQRKDAVKPTFRVLRVSAHRVIRVRLKSNGPKDPDIAVDVVRLDPPSDWHTDQIDENDRMAIDYHLVKLGPTRTRLELFVTERWVTRDFPTRRELQQRVSATWDHFSTAIEDRYRSGAPARG